MTGFYSIPTTMNTKSSSDHLSYPPLQPAWHKMIRRSRPGDRAIALQLCRAAFRMQNSGRFAALFLLADADIASMLGLTARQMRRLHEGSPLWRRESDDLLLFFADAPAEEGQSTPESYGKRRARHAILAARRRRREARRARLRPHAREYPQLQDTDTLIAAEDEPCDPLDD